MFSDKHSVRYFCKQENTKTVAEKTGALFQNALQLRHLPGTTTNWTSTETRNTSNSQNLANGLVWAYLNTFIVSIVLQSHMNTSSRQKTNSLNGSCTCFCFFFKLKQKSDNCFEELKEH
ncbi:hypothetical protein XENORESO_004678 [Xenotaenia resolanae]|uniref:Uncharacterized protein n=1 Tax=Xenotaenia resolanae TaxID=208358 RepID=A0ABV0WKR0_9TELE